MSSQFIGAIGERLVEADLLWSGWVPVNLNQSIKMAPNIDVIAAKGAQKVALQIKTAGPNSKSMVQLGYGGKGSVFNSKEGPIADFVIFVRLFDRMHHEFYVVPVNEAERVAQETYNEWLNTPKGDGSARADKCPIVIRFEPNRNRMQVSNYKERWAHYRDAWHLLDISARS